MIIIFPLGIRAWVDEKMFYSNRFEADIVRETRTGTVRLYVDKKRLESQTYMLITHALAMNGDIYEYDIISGPDEEKYIVCFDRESGGYVASGLTVTEDMPLAEKMFEFEILGNPLETPELIDMSQVRMNKEEIEALLKQAAKPIDFSKDIIVTTDESEIDFGETDEEAEIDMRNENEASVDISLALDKGAIIIPTRIGDITDEYVDYVYGLLDSERERNNIPMYIVDDNTINIYVESDYESKRQIGAYAFRIEWDGYDISDANHTENIDSQRTSELSAVVKALCTIRTPSQVRLFSSSKYVVSPFERKWIYQWEKNGWRKGEGRDKVKNSRLFSKLLDLTKVHDVEFNLVKETNKNEILRQCKKEAHDALLKV